MDRGELLWRCSGCCDDVVAVLRTCGRFERLADAEGAAVVADAAAVAAAVGAPVLVTCGQFRALAQQCCRCCDAVALLVLRCCRGAGAAVLVQRSQ